MKLYEAMFLVDSSWASANWEEVQSQIRNILERAGAEVASLKKWDERRLAYPIEKRVTGTYVLTFFRADGRKIAQIERDVQLAENIMRVLVLRADGREQDIDKDTPATLAEQRKQKAEAHHAERAAAEPAGEAAAEAGQVAVATQAEQPAAQTAAEEAPAESQGTADQPEQSAEPTAEPPQQGTSGDAGAEQSNQERQTDAGEPAGGDNRGGAEA